MRGKCLALLVLALFWIAPPQAAQAVVLYDGSNQVTPTANTTPNQAPWLWGYQTFNKSNPLTASQATQSDTTGVTTLNTTGAIADVAGYLTQIPNTTSPGYAYVRPDPQTIDSSVGFTIGFTVQINSETHTSNDRAGFSVIALTNDPTPVGIELGFWTNEVFAQNANFTHGDTTTLFTPSSGMISYQLDISSLGYSLSANGKDILDGQLRNYSAFSGGPPGNTGFPYNQRNFLFFGDDTSEASANVTIGTIGSLTDGQTNYWQNSIPCDTDNTGTVTQSDFMAVLNELDANGVHSLAMPSSAPSVYFDVNGDSMVSPLDALIIVNYLNSPTQSVFGANALAPQIEAVAVPEPSTASYAGAIALCGLLGYCFRSRAGRRTRLRTLRGATLPLCR